MSPGLRLLLRNYEEQTGACKGLALVEESCRLQSEVINHRESRWNWEILLFSSWLSKPWCQPRVLSARGDKGSRRRGVGARHWRFRVAARGGNWQGLRAPGVRYRLSMRVRIGILVSLGWLGVVAWSRGSVKKEVEGLLGSASHNCFSQLSRSEASVYRASHFFFTQHNFLRAKWPA